VARWKEGIDYELLEDGRVKCGYCGRVLKSKAAIGPHLAVCPERKKARETPSPSSPSSSSKAKKIEPIPEEYENLLSLLEDFGVKHAKAVADTFALKGNWDDYASLARYLQLSGVRPDRVQLILEAWSMHRGTVIPPQVYASLQQMWYAPNPYFNPYYAPHQGYLTKEDIEKTVEKAIESKLKENRDNGILKILLDHVLNENRSSPSFRDQLAYVIEVGKMLGWNRGDYNIYSLLKEGLDKFDKRASEALMLMQSQFAPRQFVPQQTMTPEERQRKVELIRQRLKNAEQRIEAENKFIEQFYRLKFGKPQQKEVVKK